MQTNKSSNDESSHIVLVSQCFPPEQGGNASRIGDTARHLVTEGWEVTVITPHPTFPYGQFDRTWKRHQTEQVDGISVHRIWTWQPSTEDPSFLSRMAYYLTFPIHALAFLLTQTDDYDIIFTSSPPIFTGITGSIYSRFTETPYVVDIRDLWIDASVSLGFIEEGGLMEWASRKYQQFVFRCADRITVTTKRSGEKLIDRYGISADQLIHLPNGVDTDRFSGGSDGEQAELVYTGNIGYAQDLESCVRAMAYVESDNITLKLVGDGDLKSELEQLAVDLGLENQVEFTGLAPREKIPTILNRATIGLAPLKEAETLEYAVPTKIYEYMACGLPVVATGVGEIESLIKESSGGILVNNDPKELAAVFERLLEDDEKRDKLGASGREHVIQNYERNSVAKQLDTMLRKIA